MNESVNRMVARLFDGFAESEELQALREEVLNNCQERYADLTARGSSPEEALQAVAESLKGMEEVLADYPKKPADTGSQERTLDFSAEGIRRFRADLVSFDLRVTESEDREIRMTVEGPEAERITLTREGDCLVLRESRLSESAGRWREAFTRGEGLAGLFQGLSELIQALPMQIHLGSGSVTLYLPRDMRLEAELKATSGDLAWAHPGAESLRISSTSGDVDAQTDRVSTLQASSTSGDVRVAADAETADLHSLSGDVCWNGACGALRIHTTSGEAKAAGCLRRIDAASVSGCVDLATEDTGAEEITAKSTSGSVKLSLAAPAASVKTHSVSGSVSCSVPQTGAGGARVNCSTVSGSIRVRMRG